jgi:hypothetical protein
MKFKDYAKELSLVVLGVLIALLIDNYRELVRDRKIVDSYLNIVAEDLNFDIINLTNRLGYDSSYVKKIGTLSDVLTTNADLPALKFSLASWTKQKPSPYRNLSTWDSLDYYILHLYSNSDYKTRKIGFSTIVNSNLGHQIEPELLKKIMVYYTTTSDDLDFVCAVDDKCHWNAIPYLNKYQGNFKNVILRNDFDATLIRNEVSGRYRTTLSEINTKLSTIENARELLLAIESR